jgi:SprB repeat
MKRSLLVVFAFLLFFVQFSFAACTHEANDNCANAIALTVNGTALAGNTCGTLEAGELVDCAPTGTNQSVWYSFIATASNMAVTVVSTGTCYVSSAVWPASSGCPASVGCQALSCQSADNGPATSVHDLNNLTIGATYEVQIMYASGNGCGQDGSFTIKVSTTIPNNPSNPLALSTCSAPAGPACVFNTNATVAQVTSTCTPYTIPGADTTQNHVVRSCFTFTGQYSTNISFQNIIQSTCTLGNVDWFDWQLFDTACNSISCGNINGSLSYTGVQCGQNYVMCYTWEVPACTEDLFYPYVTAIPPTFTGSSTPGTSTTGPTLNVTICEGSSVVLKGQATGYVNYIWSPAYGLSSTTGASVTAHPDTTTTYTLTGYDAGGCSQSKTIVITVKPAPAAAITLSPDSLTCTNSSVTLTASGGGTYAWSAGGTSASINVSTPNTYTVTVTGANSCSATATAAVTQNITPPAVTINPPSATLSCGVGNVTLTASGGVSYVWNTAATTDSINVSATNTYTVTATGANGCTATANDVVTSSNNGISTTATATNAVCGPNGSVTANPTGGSTYTYFWSNDSTTQTISNLPAGNYTVTVTGGGCSATASAQVILSSSTVSASASSTAAGCTPDGTATVTPSGGTNYTYFWSNDSTTQTISNLPVGTYTVTVTSGSCTATASASVASNGAAITLTPGSTPASCSGNTGTATVTPTGAGNYAYSWNTNATTQTINNLAPGTYTVTVTGAGCSATASINVTISGNLSVNPTTTPASCGNNNGSATATTTGGNGSYTYAWSNLATTLTISNLAPGPYTVTVTGGSCSGTASVNIAASTGLSITPVVTNTTCGNNNGGATLTVTGGTGGYTYQWSNSSTSGTVSNLAAGTYHVTVVDGSGCSGTASITVNPSGSDTVTITPGSQTICSGDSATYCAPAGYAVYAWNTGDNSACITTTLSGNYYVTVTDNGGCTATSNHVTLSNFTPTPVTISVNGDTLTSYTASAYQWYLNGQPIAGATNATYVATQTGNYTVEITDSHGCQYTSSITTVKVTGINNIGAAATIKVYPNPLAAGNWHVDISEALIGAACEVFDAGGQLVYKGELNSTQSEIALDVAQGIYIMQIHSPDLNYNIKLIKLY